MTKREKLIDRMRGNPQAFALKRSKRYCWVWDL